MIDDKPIAIAKRVGGRGARWWKECGGGEKGGVLREGRLAVVDKGGGLGLFLRVPLIRKITAFLLVALWLPTVQHCLLEAAGILQGHEEHAVATSCCTSATGSCETDVCGVLESGEYRPSGAQVIVPTPVLAVCTWLVPPARETILSKEFALMEPVGASFERPPDWSATWQFVERAAMSPRAPSLAVVS